VLKNWAQKELRPKKKRRPNVEPIKVDVSRKSEVSTPGHEKSAMVKICCDFFQTRSSCVGELPTGNYAIMVKGIVFGFGVRGEHGLACIPYPDTYIP
jgi:hypothetical protein